MACFSGQRNVIRPQRNKSSKTEPVPNRWYALGKVRIKSAKKATYQMSAKDHTNPDQISKPINHWREMLWLNEKHY